MLAKTPYGFSIMNGIVNSLALTYHNRHFLASVPRGSVPAVL